MQTTILSLAIRGPKGSYQVSGPRIHYHIAISCYSHAAFLLLFGAWRVGAAAVFAHFMASNSHDYTIADWTSEIQQAQASHIDAFALNMAYAEDDDQSIANVFQVASSLGFRLFFSFDYAGNGPW